MRTGAAKPGRGTHTREGASGFCNRAHVHEYTIVDEGRYFTQPPPLYWYFSAAWAAGSRCIYSTREGGICILPLFLLSTLILNVPPVLLKAFAPHSRVDSLLSTKERLSVLLSTGERLVLLSTGERLWFACCATRSARESVRRRRAPRLVRGRLDCGVPPTKGGAPAY